MSVFIGFAALGVGGALFLTASNKIIRHDAGDRGVMIRCASGFVLVVLAASTGLWSLL